MLTTSGSWWRAPSTESAASVGSGPVAASSRCGFEDGGGRKSRSRRKNRSVCACRACERRVPVAAARRPGQVIVGAEPHCAAAFGVVRGNPRKGGTPEPPVERNWEEFEQTLNARTSNFEPLWTALKNFEPARSAAPALGGLLRRSASSGTGILRDGSLWRPRIPIELTARAGGQFADTRPGSVRRVTRRHLASRATARPASDPAANADSGSVPSPETASGRSYLHENRTTSSRRTIKRLIRNGPDEGQTVCRGQ